MGTSFQADLAALDDEWQQKLPEVEDNLTSAAQQVSRAEDLTDDAFSGPAPDLLAEARDSWRRTADELAQVLRTNHDNLDRCRQALYEIARRYRAADGQH